MPYSIKGRLRGWLCDECQEPLAGVVVKFYRASTERAVERVAAAAKDTTAPRRAEEIAELEQRLVGEATVTDDGSYEAELSDNYEGEALEADLYCATVPTSRPPVHPHEPIQLHITTFAPAWRGQDGDRSVAAFEYALAARLWCAIRARFGVWVVCGQVTVCGTKEPVSGVTVRAFDVDWLQDDALGSAVTDASGHFRIDYLASDFQRTPFSPLINLEWVSGPDLYFSIESAGGTPLLQEPRSKGRTPGRENVGPCTCVELCVTGDGGGTTTPTQPLFTKVGQYHIDPVFGDFTAAGTASAGDLAFTGDIPLVGILPGPLSPVAIEYRFLVAPSGGSAAVADATDIAPTIIGQLEYFAWNSVLSAWTVAASDFWVNSPGAAVDIAQDAGPAVHVDLNVPVAADGWIPVPRTNALFPGGAGRFIPSGQLVTLRTANYTSEASDLTVPAPGLAAGAALPASAISARPTFAITFEARQVVVHTPVGTNALTRIAFSNVTDTYDIHPYWAGGPRTTTGVASLGIQEMLAAGGCAEMGDDIHVLYTVYHPYAGPPTVFLEGNPVLPAPLTPALVDGQAVSAPGGEVINIALLAKCAYILWLRVPLRLTSGSGSLGWALEDHIAFCHE